MPTATPQYRELVRLLRDGEWHEREPVVSKAGRVIQPGVAFRAAEQHRDMLTRRRRELGHVEGEPRQYTQDQMIERGRRYLVLKSIKQSTTIEEKRVDGGWKLRLVPPKMHHRTRERLEREWARAGNGQPPSFAQEDDVGHRPHVHVTRRVPAPSPPSPNAVVPELMTELRCFWTPLTPFEQIEAAIRAVTEQAIEEARQEYHR